MVDLSEAQADALDAIRRALPHKRLVLIGATAVAQYIPFDHRTSEDLDLAIDVSPESFPGALAQIPGWRADPRMEQRFYTAEGQTVDLLPASDSVRAAGKLVWPSGHEMKMEGVALAFAHATEVEDRLLLPPAPVLALMKMGSWLDRPEERRKDLDDLAHLMRLYVDEDDDEYWTPAFHREGSDHEAISPFLLGRDIGRLASEAHQPTIRSFLERATVEKLAATDAWPLTTNARTARAAFERGLRAGPQGMTVRVRRESRARSAERLAQRSSSDRAKLRTVSVGEYWVEGRGGEHPLGRPESAAPQRIRAPG